MNAAAGVLRRAAAQYGASAGTADPVQWAANQGLWWWSAQRNIARSVAQNKRTAVAAAVGVGKSNLAAAIAGWWVSTRPADDCFVMTTSASADQVHGILWEEIRAMHARHRWPGEVQQTNRWLIGKRLVGQGRRPPDYAATGDGDSMPSTGKGFHRTYVLVILDEAGGLPDWLWDMAEDITTGVHCRILAIGNPDDGNSKFARVMGGSGKWERFWLSLFDSPAFTGEVVPGWLLDKLTPVQWQEDRLADWKADDPRYISKVLGRFPPSHPRQVVVASDVQMCMARQVLHPSQLLPVKLGVDVGDGGDETVCRELRGVRFGREWGYKGADPVLRQRLVLRAILESEATEVNVDHTGVGSGLVGALREARWKGEHDAAVHSVKVAENAVHEKDYANKRAEIWWTAGRLDMHEARWDLSEMANADLTITQLQSPRWFLDRKDRIQIEPKKDIIARAGVSPDHADAFLLAAYRGSSATQDYMDALMEGRL